MREVCSARFTLTGAPITGTHRILVAVSAFTKKSNSILAERFGDDGWPDNEYRLMIGALLLEHIRELWIEGVFERLVESPALPVLNWQTTQLRQQHQQQRCWKLYS